MQPRKVAFITGASRGIGRRRALELARRGLDLSLRRLCAMLASARDPMVFGGRDIHGPTFHAEHASARFD